MPMVPISATKYFHCLIHHDGKDHFLIKQGIFGESQDSLLEEHLEKVLGHSLTPFLRVSCVFTPIRTCNLDSFKFGLTYPTS